LSLKGYKVDCIEEVGDARSNGAIGNSMFVPIEDVHEYLAQIRRMCLLSKAKNTDIYPNAQRRDQAIWRVPIGDLDYDETYLVHRATEACKSGFEQVMASLPLEVQRSATTDLAYGNQLAQVTAVEGSSDIRENRATLYRERLLQMRGRHPFLSKYGYVGIGSSFVQTGDLIVVLTGATLPFIVRPEGDKFAFLGECYCDGIMDGEIVGKRDIETITLI
jgi:hypothetical protein